MITPPKIIGFIWVAFLTLFYFFASIAVFIVTSIANIFKKE
tara:strand:- start:6064 stop:6186 length:123 start_codon:yes stop_codon:yes gene_type:complete